MDSQQGGKTISSQDKIIVCNLRMLTVRRFKVVCQDRISDNTGEKSVKLVNKCHRDINVIRLCIVIGAVCVCVQVPPPPGHSSHTCTHLSHHGWQYKSRRELQFALSSIAVMCSPWWRTTCGAGSSKQTAVEFWYQLP